MMIDLVDLEGVLGDYLRILTVKLDFENLLPVELGEVEDQCIKVKIIMTEVSIRISSGAKEI